MKLHYYPETDSLYIELRSAPGVETREIADGLNVDFDASGTAVGLDIDRASRVLDLTTLETGSPAADAVLRRLDADQTGKPLMTETTDYVPPKVWTWNKESGGRFAAINRPIAGPTHDKVLPIGKHPFQLYSLGTPNGVKVTVMFEELLAAGHAGAEYDAWLINIGQGDQFGSGFVEVNPNSKIPALMDRSGPTPIRIFESGAILIHLAEKFGAFLPTTQPARAETLSWLMWLMGAAPYLGGGFGHFYAYAPTKIEYAIDRFAMEVKRQLDVLDRRLGEARYLAGDEYTIADMAVWPWYGNLAKGLAYESGEFLSVQDYKNVQRWTDDIAARPAVKRGRMVNRAMGDPASQLRERHDAADFDTRTQDKLEPAKT